MVSDRKIKKRIWFSIECFRSGYRFSPWLEKYNTEDFNEETSVEFVNFIESLSKIIFDNLFLAGFIKKDSCEPCLATIQGVIVAWYKRIKREVGIYDLPDRIINHLYKGNFLA